jgi:hypothetical protein
MSGFFLISITLVSAQLAIGFLKVCGIANWVGNALGGSFGL